MSAPTIITSTVIIEPLPNYFGSGMNYGIQNAIGSVFVMPQCYIPVNPYGGTTGLFGLLNCIAIQNTGITAIIRFYQPPGGIGVILGFSNAQYPNGPSGWVPWVYIGNNGYLYIGDWADFAWQISFPLTPGWHTLVASEYYSGGTYYIVAYLDSTSNTASNSITNLPTLFGWLGPFPYGDIGTEYSAGAWPNTNQAWFFFNGAIDYIALYPGAVTTSQVEFLNYPTQSYNAIDKLPPGYVVLLTANSLTLTSWVDVVNGTSYYLVSGALQPGIFGQITQQGTTITNGPPPNQCWQPWGPVTCG